MECPSYSESFGAKGLQDFQRRQGDPSDSHEDHRRKPESKTAAFWRRMGGKGGPDPDLRRPEFSDSRRGRGRLCLCSYRSYQNLVGRRPWAEPASASPVLTPVLTYEIRLPQGTDVHGMLIRLRQLEEEIPELQILWNEQLERSMLRLWGKCRLRSCNR